MTGGSVEVISVEEPIEWTSTPVAPGWSVPHAYEAGREARATHRAQQARKLVYTDLVSSVETPYGDPAAIMASASADVDLLICGSREYGPLRSVILGSVSRTLANSAHCPLLIIPRPPAHDATKLWHNPAVEGALSP